MNNFDIELIKKYISKDKQEEALNKLKQGYPVQYIIGNVDFYGLTIEVNENVLIPRFETEYLVDDLIKYIKSSNFSCPNILDIGTGSGCISLSLKNNIECNVDAIDISQKALEVAKNNSQRLNLDINFINSSIENYISNKKYDVIVSNPPYVDINSKYDEKIKYEPQNAIFAKDNGLYFYKLILNKSKELLKDKFIIAFEIGDKQSNYICNLAKDIYPDSIIISKKDLNNYERYIFIINN